VEVTLPVVLFCCPAAVPVTLIENVQELLAARLAPERLTPLVPCVAVIVPPPHEPDRPLGVGMIRPAGNVSLKATPLNATVVLVFWMLNCKLVDPLSGIEAAPNALMLTGGATTVIDPSAVFPVPPSVEVI